VYTIDSQRFAVETTTSEPEVVIVVIRPSKSLDINAKCRRCSMTTPLAQIQPFADWCLEHARRPWFKNVLSGSVIIDQQGDYQKTNYYKVLPLKQFKP
jgi:hypothetical protein